MATFLFDKIIFGPIHSRRLGVSLGVNLLPVNTKVCSFNCIYCECGLTPEKNEIKAVIPSREKVRDRLKEKLIEMGNDDKLPDVITFAGNGEPTMHPEFAGVIADTIDLRDEFAPKARIAVLSNASMIHKSDVFKALLRIEDNIQKLDSAFQETVELIDCPKGNYSLEKVVDSLIKFNGKVIIQTLFLKGMYKGKNIDNTTEKEVKAWINLLKKIKPSQVMIYTIARDTPINTLVKANKKELDDIAEVVKDEGFNVQVSY